MNRLLQIRTLIVRSHDPLQKGRVVTMARWFFLAALFLAALTLLLTACAPTSAGEEEISPIVAIINAPAEARVSTLADSLERRIREVPSCCAFSFVRSQPVRFQETHRDMFGSRAVPQALSLAENLSARLAVMASAPRFERNVETHGDHREVSGEVQVRAVLFDVETGERLATVGSLTFRGSRTADADGDLPEIEEDPIMQQLTEQAAEDLAPHLAAVLTDVAGDYR